MTSPIQGELLIVGYARDDSISYLPKEIEELIQAFWSEFSGVWWKIKGKQLKKFFNLKQISRKYPINEDRLLDENHISGQKFKSHSIGITPIIYNCFAYQDKVRVMCFEFLFNIPSNVKSIQVYHKLYCKETNALFEKWHNISDWKTKKCNIQPSDQLKIVLHADKGMNNLTELNVMYFCEIYKIEYKKEAIEKTYFRELRMLQHFEYEWQLNAKEIRMLKRGPDKYEMKSIKSELFNDGVFQLSIEPRWNFSWNRLAFHFRAPHEISLGVKAHVEIGTKSVCSTLGEIEGSSGYFSHLELTSKFDDFVPEIGSDCSIHAKFEIIAVWSCYDFRC